MLHLGVDPVRVHAAGEGEHPLEPAVGALIAVPPLALLLGHLLLLALNGQDLVFQAELHILGAHPGKLDHDAKVLLVLEHLARGRPCRSERPPVPFAAQRFVHHPAQAMKVGIDVRGGLGRSACGGEKHPVLLGEGLRASWNTGPSGGGRCSRHARATAVFRSDWQTGRQTKTRRLSKWLIGNGQWAMGNGPKLSTAYCPFPIAAACCLLPATLPVAPAGTDA